jgi:hypothetical protein
MSSAVPQESSGTTWFVGATASSNCFITFEKDPDSGALHKVIADEAHRSQYGFGGKVNEKTGKMSYVFASNLRDALPNASYIGFTGGHIEKTDANTRAVFGDYISIYDIQRAVACQLTPVTQSG